MFIVDRFDNTNISNRKMDILFYEAVKGAKSTYNKKIICHALKFVLLLVFYIVDLKVLKSDRQKIFILMRLGMASSILNIIVNFIISSIGYRNTVKNNTFFLFLSQQMQHATNERLNPQQDLQNLQNCVSNSTFNAYNQTQNNDAALTPELRKRFITIYKNLIEGEVLQKNKCLPFLDFLARILSLATVIYGIVALVISHPHLWEIIVLAFFLLLESYNIWGVIVVLLLIVFSPIICCFACVYVICLGGRGFVDTDNLNIPPPVKANTNIIEKTDGSCSVCLQDFKLNEKLIVLPCNQKHAFHQNCIMSWLKVSDTCPICRKRVPQAV